MAQKKVIPRRGLRRRVDSDDRWSCGKNADGGRGQPDLRRHAGGQHARRKAADGHGVSAPAALRLGGAPEIKRVDDLLGKKVAVADRGSVTFMVARAILHGHGLCAGINLRVGA